MTKEYKNKEAIEQWFSRIDHSRQYKEKQKSIFRWDALTEEYRGNFTEVQQASDIYIPPLNLIYAYVKSEMPALAARDPKIKVNPKKGTTVLSSKILEKALNYIWRTKKIKRENRKNLMDNMFAGHSWFKTGYTGSFGTIEDANGSQSQFIQHEDFFGYRIPYENIFFNPDAQDPPYDCTWIAHEVWMPLEELKKDKSFKNTAKLQPTAGLFKDSYKGKDNKDNLRSPDVPMIKLYEVWDKRSKTKFVITEGCFEYLQEPDKWPYKMKGFPFSFLRLNEDPTNPYGIPDIYPFEVQVIELMKIRATEIDHLKRGNRQLLLAEGHMSDEALAQFKQGITGAVLQVRTDNRPLSDIVSTVPYAALQTDIYAVEDRIAYDIINISGQTPGERGASQKTTTRTISELMEIDKGAKNRRSDKVDVMEDFVEDIAYNLTCLLQQLADTPYFIRILGDDQEVIQGLEDRKSAKAPGSYTGNDGFTFNKDDIAGEFDFEVVSGSMAPLDSTRKVELLTFLVEQLPKMGVMPGGPVYKYIGDELADELDLEGLKLAIKEEQKLAEERAQQQAAQAELQMQMQAGMESAELKIKAEREATKQAKLTLDAVTALKPQPKGEKPNV